MNQSPYINRTHTFKSPHPPLARRRVWSPASLLPVCLQSSRRPVRSRITRGSDAQTVPAMPPSYDYDALVASLVRHRREAYAKPAPADPSIRLEHLQKSVEIFSTLSSHCPMTPLLWMQYGDDAAEVVRGLLLTSEGGEEEAAANQQAAETRVAILELAAEEFPACALLRLRHVEAVVEGAAGDGDSQAAVRAAFHGAMSAVGRGSHRNEDGIVAAIFRLHVGYLEGLKASTSAPASPPTDGDIAEEIGASYLARAECPMREENDAVGEEIAETRTRVNGVLTSAEDVQRLEEARMSASRTFDAYANLEDGVDAAMAEESIALPRQIGKDGREVDWSALLHGRDALEGRARYLMGLGGQSTSGAFARYASVVSNRAKRMGNTNATEGKKEQGSTEDDDARAERESLRALTIAVYERGLSTCPTVESLWASYLNHLFHTISSDLEASNGKLLGQSQHVALLKSASARAVRNCPYSVRLFGMKLKAISVTAKAGAAVYDPDEIAAVVTEATAGGFLPSAEAELEVHLRALGNVRRRILALSCTASPEEVGVAKEFDELEPVSKFRKKKRGEQDVTEITAYADVGVEAEEEMVDLIDDLREMYDAAELSLKKRYSSWTEGRALLWANRARTEAYLLTPLLRSLNGDSNDTEKEQKITDEALRCFEKSVRTHQPTHPDVWAAYIRYVLGRSRFLDGEFDVPGANAAKFRKVRGLYQRAMASMKAQIMESGSSLDQRFSFALRSYNSALSNICYEYLDYEWIFGSDDTYIQASKVVRGKLRPLGENSNVEAELGGSDTPVATSYELAPSMDIEDTVRSGKRELDQSADKNGTAVYVPLPKKAKIDTINPIDDNTGGSIEPEQKKTNLKIQKRQSEHKIRIGHLEYPAHRFTIHVRNLSPETEDMDLVDAFQPRCGAIVHARIFREKHRPGRYGKPQSKGAGLIQFEDPLSVEKALELDGAIGLHDKLVAVSRSHVAAAAIVPQGTYRVKPKGEGKHSKRNKRSKEAKTSGSGETLVDSEEAKQSEMSESAGTFDGRTKVVAGDKAESIIPPKFKPEPKTKTDIGALAFRPRGIRGKKHIKVKLDLDHKK